MGTKQNPGEFDCYTNALPDEPMFVLLARDPLFYKLVLLWAEQRELDINCGNRPKTDIEMVKEATKCAMEGQEWRRRNLDKWRKP